MFTNIQFQHTEFLTFVENKELIFEHIPCNELRATKDLHGWNAIAEDLHSSLDAFDLLEEFYNRDDVDWEDYFNEVEHDTGSSYGPAACIWRLNNNPNACEFLKTHRQCISWSMLMKNPGMKDLIEEFFQEEQLFSQSMFRDLCGNEKVSYIALRYVDHIHLNTLCLNIHAIDIIAKKIDEVTVYGLSNLLKNKNAIPLVIKHAHKFDKCRGKDTFVKYDYTRIEQCKMELHTSIKYHPRFVAMEICKIEDW